MLLFYPGDWTFVCPTEIYTFSDRIQEFKDLNTQASAESVGHFAAALSGKPDGGRCLGEVAAPGGGRLGRQRALPPRLGERPAQQGRSRRVHLPAAGGPDEEGHARLWGPVVRWRRQGWESWTGGLAIARAGSAVCRIVCPKGVAHPPPRRSEDDGEEPGRAFRGLFIISDKGILRHVTVNDFPVGRSVDEVLRLIKAFQFTDENGEVCPANWKPGSKVRPDSLGEDGGTWCTAGAQKICPSPGVFPWEETAWDGVSAPCPRICRRWWRTPTSPRHTSKPFEWSSDAWAPCGRGVHRLLLLCSSGMPRGALQRD